MGFVHILEGWALGFATISLYCITAVHNGCMKGQNLQMSAGLHVTVLALVVSEHQAD